jgi:hypothetical protein
MGDLPMWWLRGHQESKPLVKTSKACRGVAFTVTLRHTEPSDVGLAAALTFFLLFHLRRIFWCCGF